MCSSERYSNAAFRRLRSERDVKRSSSVWQSSPAPAPAALDSYSLVANDEIAETFGLNSTLHGDERDAVFGQARYRATD